jgi:hypothetical protein
MRLGFDHESPKMTLTHLGNTGGGGEGDQHEPLLPVVALAAAVGVGMNKAMRIGGAGSMVTLPA